MVLLPLDDLIAVVREFINPAVSRAGLDRYLRRHGVASLRALQAKALADAGEIRPTFKIFRLRAWLLAHGHQVPPQMPDENHRRYLFVAIDRATRCSPITAASSRIASPAKNTNLQEPTSLICVAKPSISNTVYVCRATRRLMAWSSDSMPESAK